MKPWPDMDATHESRGVRIHIGKAVALFYATSVVCCVVLALSSYVLAALQIEPPPASDIRRILIPATAVVGATGLLASFLVRGVGQAGFFAAADAVARLPRRVFMILILIPGALFALSFGALIVQLLVFQGIPENQGGRYLITNHGALVGEVPRWDFIWSTWITFACCFALSGVLSGLGVAAGRTLRLAPRPKPEAERAAEAAQ